MNFCDLLTAKGIGLKRREVLVMRHRPPEPELRKVFPWLADERPELFNDYQRSQHEKAERAMSQAKYLASFIGHEPGSAVFIGLYKIEGSRSISYDQFWGIAANRELRDLGMKGFSGSKRTRLRFDLKLTDIYRDWKGKLIVDWPGGERSWWRWSSSKNAFPVRAILQESVLSSSRRPNSRTLVLNWNQLGVLPTLWKSILSEWRGVYFIFDVSKCKGYVGAAYGVDNLYSRWLNYSKTGHGGNTGLRKCKPQNLLFSILELVSPQASAADVLRLENSWKDRLHTRNCGLNKN